MATTLNALLVEAHAIAERVIAADGDQIVDAQEIQVLEHLGGQVVDLVLVLIPQVFRDSSLATWLGRVREVCRKVPPVRPALLTISSVRI